MAVGYFKGLLVAKGYSGNDEPQANPTMTGRRTREGLVARVEADLGHGCFGDSAWKDNSYRDIRVVKMAL